MSEREPAIPSPVDVDRLVHEPARLVLLAHLAVVEAADFGFLLQQTRLTKGNLSSHMSRLEAAGYISVQKELEDGRPVTWLSITGTGQRALAEYRELLGTLLGALPGR